MSDINHNVCPVIDLSNTRVRVLIGEFKNNDISLLACASVKNEGVKNGKIVAMPDVIEALKTAITEAEKQSGYQIHSVNASIDGAQTSETTIQDRISISGGEIREKDVDFLIARIQDKIIQRGYAPVHFIQQYFSINGSKSALKNPISMKGDNLFASVYAIFSENNTLKNIKTAIRKTGVNLNALISSSYATAFAATTAQERQNGAFVLNIGYETSQCFGFKNGYPVFGIGFLAGGKEITNKISERLRISPELAEQLKLQYGDISYEGHSYEIPTSSVTMPVVKSSDLSVVIQQAYKEIFTKLSSNLPKGEKIPRDIILTGGPSMIKGISDFLLTNYGATARVEYYNPLNDEDDLGLITAFGMLKLRYSNVRDFNQVREKKYFSFTQKLRKFMEV